MQTNGPTDRSQPTVAVVGASITFHAPDDPAHRARYKCPAGRHGVRTAGGMRDSPPNSTTRNGLRGRWPAGAACQACKPLPCCVTRRTTCVPGTAGEPARLESRPQKPAHECLCADGMTDPPLFVDALPIPRQTTTPSIAIHNPVRPRYCANQPPTPAEDHPVPPPPSEKAGRSIVIPRPRGARRGLPPGSWILRGWGGARVVRGWGTARTDRRNRPRNLRNLPDNPTLGSLTFAAQSAYDHFVRGGVAHRNPKAASASRFSSTTCYPAGFRVAYSPIAGPPPEASRIERLTFRGQTPGTAKNLVSFLCGPRQLTEKPVEI